jgi:hypothetical protein
VQLLWIRGAVGLPTELIAKSKALVIHKMLIEALDGEAWTQKHSHKASQR